MGRGHTSLKSTLVFGNLKIDPKDIWLLGLKHEKYFLDLSLPFRFRLGTSFFQGSSDYVRYSIKKFYAYDIINYADDICTFSTPSQSEKLFQTLKMLLKDLGFKLSMNKLIHSIHEFWPRDTIQCI